MGRTPVMFTLHGTAGIMSEEDETHREKVKTKREREGRDGSRKHDEQ